MSLQYIFFSAVLLLKIKIYSIDKNSLIQGRSQVFHQGVIYGGYFMESNEHFKEFNYLKNAVILIFKKKIVFLSMIYIRSYFLNNFERIHGLKTKHD